MKLATRSCIARPTATGYRGIYVHDDGFPSNHVPLLLTARRYRFAGSTPALARHLIDTDAIGWDSLGDDLFDGAPDILRTVLNPDAIGPSTPTDASRIVTSDGSPPKRMVFDETSAPGRLDWAYVLRTDGIEVIALTDHARGPVVGWDTDPLISVSNQPPLWGQGLPVPLAAPPPAFSAARAVPAAPPTERQHSRR